MCLFVVSWRLSSLKGCGIAELVGYGNEMSFYDGGARE
jgi:hypothetical protein